MRDGWFFSIDRGGTFTDVIGIAPDGSQHSSKLLSQSRLYSDSAIEGIRRTLGLDKNARLPNEKIKQIRMGTTVATNALLERKGEPVALLTTEGFSDLLEIGRQDRPDLFALAIKKPANLYTKVVEVKERIDAFGSVLEPVDKSVIEKRLRDIYESGIRSIAIVFLHSWINPAHEEAVAIIARKIGFPQVSVSSELIRSINVVGRGRTCMIDAYLSPLLKRYVDQVKKSTGSIPLYFMKSAGGLAEAKNFTGKDAVLSGPAGGVLAVASQGDEQFIGFDMGGTSTDVCRFHNEYERLSEMKTAGLLFTVDSLRIETVASGGGSILGFDGERMTVGPESAGADPGPACYGKGGPLTVTDANLLLGRIPVDAFPKSFGPDETGSLQRETACEKFRELTDRINNTLSLSRSVEEVALGYIRIADEIMAKPIRKLSIARGYDIREHTLCAFGGAGALHACSIAKILGVKQVIVHPLAGLFSAYGIALANHLDTSERTVLLTFDEDRYESITGIADEMIEKLQRRFIAQGNNEKSVKALRYLQIRVKGNDASLPVRDDGYNTTKEKFISLFTKRFGFEPEGNDFEVVSVRVEVTSGEEEMINSIVEAVVKAPVTKTVMTLHRGVAKEVDLHRRKSLAPGDDIITPALILDDHCTILADDDFTCRIDNQNRLVMTAKSGSPCELKNADKKADPVTLEIFNHAFMSLAEQMGETLIKTAHSVNMKERLDFSCALFDSEGRLIANAPHIPVHLGAMGESVKWLIGEKGAALVDGDIYVSNHPAKGGSHLPDITVITPLFPTNGKTPDFFVATRGHHSDIGGKTPGSISPFSQSLDEEGVVIDNFLLVSNGNFRESEARVLFLSGRYPARRIEERISDLKAQVAANRKGELELNRLSKEHGIETVKAYTIHIRKNAAHSLQLALGGFLDSKDIFESEFTDYLDEGAAIKVNIRITSGENPPFTHHIKIDFTGTSPEIKNSLNAPFAVVRASVLYVLRTLIDRDIPLNDGCMEPVTLVAPKNSIISPSASAAVAGGNVETSQRIVDTLYGALGIAGASQGTMNNIAIGWPDGGFYETIAGGSGAIKGNEGASAVQVHMTNTRITDPETLERRFPGLRLNRFSIRRGSGGEGEWKGGDGAVREYQILEPCEVTILSERRKTSPYGANGGSPGKPGINELIRNGKRELLSGHTVIKLKPGDILRINTPGGGGYGNRI